MTVVVTGANGFIGQRLVGRLVEAGSDVVAVVQPGTAHVLRRWHPRLVVELDLAELSALPGHMQSAELVYHLAWVGVAPQDRNDAKAQLLNLGYALDLVSAAANLGVLRIICPGSMSEFALHDGPVSGYEDPSPVDLYSATKVAARQLMGVRCADAGIGLVWTFVTSVYGPGRKDSSLISYAIRTLLAGDRPDFTGLEQTWDYVYIDDLIEALHLLGRHGIGGKRYPIGSGTALPMLEYVEQLRDAIDPTLALGIGRVPYKSTRLDSSIPDITALAADTGYRARTSFADGITRTIEYFRRELPQP